MPLPGGTPMNVSRAVPFCARWISAASAYGPSATRSVRNSACAGWYSRPAVRPSSVPLATSSMSPARARLVSRLSSAARPALAALAWLMVAW